MVPLLGNTRRGLFRVAAAWWSGLAIWLALPAGAVHGQEPLAPGLFISINNPITSKEMSRVREITESARLRHNDAVKDAGQDPPPRLTIIYDFNPRNQEASTIDRGACSDLARYLLSLTDVYTVAFIHGKVTGHTVLPVLACHEIVMSSQGELGEVMKDENVSLPVDIDRFYADPIVADYSNAAKGRGRSRAIVLKMLDPNLEIHEGDLEGTVQFYDVRRKPAGVVPTGIVLPRGRKKPYSVEEAIKFGLCKAKIETRQDVAAFYKLPPSSLREDPLLGRTPVAWLIEVRGEMTRSMEQVTRRRIQRAVGRGANLIVLQLECGGGSPVVANNLAQFIRNLKDNKGVFPVMTVAYVTEQALDTAAYLALASDQIVLNKRAKLGEFERLLEKHPSYQAAIGTELAALARENFYSPLLAQGMVDVDLEIYRVMRLKGAAERRYMSGKELRDHPDEWQDEGQIKRKGQYLVMDATKAKDLGFSRYVVDNLEQVYQHYNLEPTEVTRAGPDWLERFATFLRNPMMAVILVMVGITCLVLELKLPGIGLPGVAAALCFILFFWAHSQLEFTWLAVLLFLLGLVFIGMEIFVTPGFGVLGISGIFMVMGGLGLATLERIPQTQSEWVSTFGNMGQFGVALVVAVVIAMIIGRYLPSIPYANRLVLPPPEERADAFVDQAPDIDQTKAAALLGAIGVAATPLRPAGMIRVNDEFIDVTAEGSFVESGCRVQVIEIEGNRVVVKEI